MSKYLHILNNGHPSVPKNMVLIIKKYFDPEEHQFVIVSPKEIDAVKNEPNVRFIDSFDTKLLISMVKDAKYVFMHSFFFRIDMIIYLLLHKKQMDKMIWVAWGMDLYENTRVNSIKSYIRDRFKRRLKYFIGIFPPDIEFFKKHYGDRAKTFYAPYSGVKTSVLYSTEPQVVPMSDKLRNNETINVLVGHQSNPKLNHIGVIDKLERFKDENIMVYIPLSYGDKAHADRVEAYAKMKLGQKVSVLREFMDFAAYRKLLSSIDIAIFDTDRQIALGNINPLLYMQKKMYLNGVMYEYFRSKGINVCKADSISEFDDFVKDADMSNASMIIKRDNSVENKIEKWNDVFEALK